MHDQQYNTVLEEKGSEGMSVSNICASACACALLLACVASAEHTYTTKYDSVDLDEVLASERLLSSYIECLMSQGPCTADAKELKKNLPDAIENDCQRCTEKQREGSAKVMHYIIEQRPQDWSRLEAIYNPDGSYRKAYLNSKNQKNGSKENNNSELSITNDDDTAKKE